MALSTSIRMLSMALLLCACSKEQMDDCVTSTGPHGSETRAFASFRMVELNDRIDLVLDDLPDGHVVVEGGQNLLGQVRTEGEDGVLRIHNDNSCNWVRRFEPRLTVRVPIAHVEELLLRGTGNVSAVDTVRHAVFRVEQRSAEGHVDLTIDVSTCFIGLHSGAGDVVLRGRTSGQANLFSGQMGSIDASGMRSRFVHITNDGVADIRCWVTVELDVRLLGVGDVYYRGDPPYIQSEVIGTGQLIAMDQ